MLFRSLRRRAGDLASRRVLTDPMAVVSDKHLLLDRAQRDLGRAALGRLAEPKRELAALAASLDALSPLKVLGRGFAVVADAAGAPLRRAADVPVGSQIEAKLAEGSLLCRVEEARE